MAIMILGHKSAPSVAIHATVTAAPTIPPQQSGRVALWRFAAAGYVSASARSGGAWRRGRGDASGERVVTWRRVAQTELKDYLFGILLGALDENLSRP
jgi:hypothetical protein